MSGGPAVASPDGVAVPRVRRSALRSTLELARSPDRFLERLAASHGKAVSLRLLGFGETVWITDPAAVKDAYADPEHLRQGEASAPLLSPLLGEHSVLTLDGPRHMRQRKLLLPPFHGEAVRAYAQTFAELTDAELASWRVGERFRLRPRMQRLTIEAILTAVFGVVDAAERQRLVRAASRLMALLWMSGLGERFRRDRGPLSPWGRFVRRRDALDALLYEQISRRRDRPAEGDVLSLLMAATDEDGEPMSDEELRDELVTLLLAGHDTTANTLAWAFDLVLRRPDVERRIIEEARAGERAYTEAVITETLRLRPVVPFTGRVAAGDVVLGGYRIPRGTRVWQPALLLQRDADAFPDPLAFKPERWLDAKPPGFRWIPFGGGVRRCIGAAFASLEMRVVLQQVLARAELRLRDDRPERPKLNNVVLVPRHGVRVRLAGWR